MSLRLADASPPDSVRPLSHWLKRYPPGFLSGLTAQIACPLTLAAEIHVKAEQFADWLALPRDERWDSFALQTFSASLFNRYRTPAMFLSHCEAELLELSWPPECDDIRQAIRELRKLLAAPFAVYRAARAPLVQEPFPTAPEFCLADEALEAAREELRSIVRRLGWALQSRSDAERSFPSAIPA